MKFVEPPTAAPARYGLLEAATVVDDPDPHIGFGVQFQPNCGVAHTTLGACVDPPESDTGGRGLGEATISVSVDEQATLDTPFGEPGSYTIVWGDGSQDTIVFADDATDLDAVTHIYPGIVGPDQVYDLHVHGPVGYHVHIEVTVSGTPATPTGPFTGTATDAGGVSEFSREKQVTDGVPVEEAPGFATYHLAQCRAPGGIADAEARARQSFALAEERAVEEWFGTFLTLSSGAVDLSAGLISAVDGLAILEKYAGSTYGGVPVIHMDRATATILLAAGALTVNRSRLETLLGSRVAAGGGYDGVLGAPGGAVPPDPGAYMSVPGAVGAWRGDILVTDALMSRAVPVPGADSMATNEFRLLVERPYVVAAECITAAVLINRTTCACELIGGEPQ